MKKTILILFLYFLNLSSAYSIAPDVFVQSTVNRASQVLSKNISKEVNFALSNSFGFGGQNACVVVKKYQ